MIDMVKIGDHKSWIFTDSAPPPRITVDGIWIYFKNTHYKILKINKNTAKKKDDLKLQLKASYVDKNL